MSISEEIRECCSQSHKDWLWQKQEEGEIPKEEEIVKKESRVDNKYIVKTILKMGKRAMPRWTDSLPPTLKELYVDCYYEVSIQAIGGYPNLLYLPTLKYYTSCFFSSNIRKSSLPFSPAIFFIS